MTVGFSLDTQSVVPRDAATVILVRDSADGLELFFVKRSGDIRFLGGAFMFPGGKVDAQDDDPTLPSDLDAAQCAELLQISDTSLARALFIGAARECVEESGILHSTRPVTSEQLATLRHKLDVEKQPFAQLLRELSVTLQLAALQPFARWITPRAETRRFDARFFLAQCPATLDASHDTRETVDSCWLSPKQAIKRANEREIVLVPPTYRTVQVLSSVHSVAEALQLVATTLEPLEPWVRSVDDGAFEILLPDDREHPQCTPLPWNIVDRSALTTRFRYADGVWTPFGTYSKH